MNEVATQAKGSVLAIRGDQGDWTQEQAMALLGMFNLQHAPGEQIRAFFHLCQATGLDPFKRQIYLIERSGKFTPQTSIDGFRLIRDRSGVFDGGVTEWCGADGVWRDVWLEKQAPAAARYTLHRTDQNLPAVGTALWDAYVQTRGKDGAVTHMWQKMGPHMLAKVAEALAIRMAFPDSTGGLYTDDEMAQADGSRNAEPGESFTDRRQVQRERSPGLMDLQEPPVAPAAPVQADPGVGGGFMQVPSDEPEAVVGEVVEEQAPAADPAPAPAEVPVDAEVVAEAGGAPIDMNPAPEPEPSHQWLWAGRLSEVVESPGFSETELRGLHDAAAEAGALQEQVPWANYAPLEAVIFSIVDNLRAGRAPSFGIV